LSGEKSRSAFFQSIIAVAQAGELHSIFEGKIEGVISETLRGDYGFAFDVCFVPHGFKKTFAEMSFQEKNKISHRRRALEKFVQFLPHSLE
jgi:XTP/dITP diphosphohydrolase